MPDPPPSPNSARITTWHAPVKPNVKYCPGPDSACRTVVGRGSCLTTTPEHLSPEVHSKLCSLLAAVTKKQLPIPYSVHDFHPITPEELGCHLHATTSADPVSQYKIPARSEPRVLDGQGRGPAASEVISTVPVSIPLDKPGGITLVPIEIHHVQLRAIWDTAAEWPVLRESFCKRYGIPLLPVKSKQCNPSFWTGSILPCMQTPMIQVRISTRSNFIEAEFLVLPDDDSVHDYDCLLGGKLRLQLGILGLSDVPRCFPTPTDSTVLLPDRSLLSAVVNYETTTTDGTHDDFIVEELDDIPAPNPYQLPASYQSLQESRQHVVDHPNDPTEADSIARLCEPIHTALQRNNDVCTPPNFIDHPDATVSLKHLPGTQPKYLQQPRMPPVKTQAVRAQIQKWLTAGKIRLLAAHERHKWNSQMLCAPKKGQFDADGIQKYRVCFNGKPTVNIGLINDPGTIPRINDLLALCAGKAFFTELDAEDAYLQLILDAESQDITAFEFEGRSYCFIGAPYGITFIGNVFQRVMTKIFADLHFVIVYIDNIWIVTPDDMELHQSQVLSTIQRCTDRRVRLNLRKPVLFKREFVGFGHHISAHGISLDPKKVASATSWEPRALKTSQQLRSFLGATQFLRRNIRFYSDLTARLHIEASKPKTTVINWDNSEIMSSFVTLQQAIATAPTIRYADMNKQFALATDSSRVARGACLFQPTTPGEMPNENNIISFWSETLHKHERGYSAFKLELACVVFAVRHYSDFLWGNDFLLYTDHASLVHIWNLERFNNTYAGWILELLDYTFTIHHVAGTSNIVPDQLSRVYINRPWGLDNNPPAPRAPPLPICRSIHNPSFVCPVLGGGIPESAQFQTEPILSDSAQASAVHSQPITDSPVIPSATDQQRQLILDTHLRGHFGVQSVYRTLKREGHHWPHMFHHVRVEVASCEPCQLWTIAKPGYHPVHSPDVLWPFDLLEIDFDESYPPSSSGNTVMLVIVDAFTHYCFLRPLPNKQACTVAATIFSVFRDFGPPRIIQSDNESMLVSELAHEFTTLFGVNNRHSIPYCHHSQGLVERTIGVTSQCVHKMISESGVEWDRASSLAQLYINMKVKDITNTDPFSLLFARTCNLSNSTRLQSPTTTTAPFSVDDWIQHQKLLEDILLPGIRHRQKTKQQEYLDRFQRTHPIARDLPPGTLVALRDVTRTTKNDPPYLAPYTVVSKDANGGYHLRDAAGGSLARSVPAHHIRPLFMARHPATNTTFYVDYIIQHRVSDIGDEYLVKWINEPTSASTWVPYADITDKSLIREFNISLNRISKTRKSKRVILADDSIVPEPKIKAKTRSISTVIRRKRTPRQYIPRPSQRSLH